MDNNEILFYLYSVALILFGVMVGMIQTWFIIYGGW